MDLSEIQMRLYKATLLTGIGLSVACIIDNLLVGFPLEMNLKWLLLLGLCSISFFIRAVRNAAGGCLPCIYF